MGRNKTRRLVYLTMLSAMAITINIYLHMEIERYVSDNSVTPERDKEFIKKCSTEPPICFNE